ncbi:MAG: hypothetical protein GYB33_11240 [Gammaproteobacteria bacterium]|nr:hypothetical protein [Gammaproteobacteria bacterium]
MPDDQREQSPQDSEVAAGSSKLRHTMSWIIVVILVLFGAGALYRLFTFSKPEDTFWNDLFVEQFPVLVGMPMAGLGALFVTLILRISTGPLEFEIGGLKFKGGAAPIVFWIICFLSIVVSIKMLWQT